MLILGETQWFPTNEEMVSKIVICYMGIRCQCWSLSFTISSFVYSMIPWGKNIEFRIPTFSFSTLLRYYKRITLFKLKVYNVVILYMYILKKNYHRKVSWYIRHLIQLEFLRWEFFFFGFTSQPVGS